MKSKFLAIVVATAILLCTCAIGVFADVDVSSGYSSVSTHKSQKYPVKNSTIVTFGDSVTAYAGWQDEIEALGAMVVNSGTGGMTVKNSMQSFGAKVLSNKPDFATIMFGFNDGNRGKSTGNGTEAVNKEVFKAYYKEFVRLCRENDIIPIIITQHTCVESIWYSDSRYPGTESFYEETNGVSGWFDSYADVAREVASEMNVNLIDWNAYSKKFNETDIISSDGVHLSNTGKDALGALVSDYLSANFAGDAASTEKISYPKLNTVLIEDFNSSTEVPENFTQNGKTASTLTITDEMSAGNNALKNVGAEWSGPKYSFDDMPENCIGLRFKMYTSAPTYSIWAFDSATNINSRVYDVRYITNYVYDAFVPCNFYFDDYTVKKGSVSDIISFTIMAQSGKTVYFDDFEWIVEDTQDAPQTTISTSESTTAAPTTIAPTTAAPTTAAPTTAAPTTIAPTTAAPTTAAPTTATPTTIAPTTVAPTTATPTTAAPTTITPTTIAPTTATPTTATPTTIAPTTATPTTATPTTIAPTTAAPTTAAPTTIAPTTAAPTTAAPTTAPTSVVISVNYGDANGDGSINLLDLVALRKHLAKWNISIDSAAADCNADGNINLLDLILMRKYLARWDVVLGK
ncbi:MAG: GDSL-type esterase/lipase family protein [Acutalibacteraceae bacterium]